MYIYPVILRLLFSTQQPDGAPPVLLPGPRGPRGGDLHRLCPQVRRLHPCNICTKISFSILFFFLFTYLFTLNNLIFIFCKF